MKGYVLKLGANNFASFLVYCFSVKTRIQLCQFGCKPIVLSHKNGVHTQQAKLNKMQLNWDAVRLWFNQNRAANLDMKNKSVEIFDCTPSNESSIFQQLTRIPSGKLSSKTCSLARKSPARKHRIGLATVLFRLQSTGEPVSNGMYGLPACDITSYL